MRPNGPKCTQIVPNAPKRQFMVQRGGSGAFVVKNYDANSWHELLHQFGPFCSEFSKASKRSQMHQNSTKLTKTSVQNWTQNFVLVRFILFWSIWERLVALQNSVQNRPNQCKSSCHEVTSEFSAMNVPGPSHQTPNRSFGAFRTIWVHFGPFSCLTKLGAKRAQKV